MRREIYKVYAEIVDANGTYNTISGFPKIFDSKSYSNDIEKALKRAYADYHESTGAMGKRDDRQLQLAYIVRLNDGVQIAKFIDGMIADLPDPEPEPEPESEPEPEEG